MAMTRLAVENPEVSSLTVVENWTSEIAAQSASVSTTERFGGSDQLNEAALRMFIAGGIVPVLDIVSKGPSKGDVD